MLHFFPLQPLMNPLWVREQARTMVQVQVRDQMIYKKTTMQAG